MTHTQVNWNIHSYCNIGCNLTNQDNTEMGFGHKWGKYIWLPDLQATMGSTQYLGLLYLPCNYLKHFPEFLFLMFQASCIPALQWRAKWGDATSGQYCIYLTVVPTRMLACLPTPVPNSWNWPQEKPSWHWLWLVPISRVPVCVSPSGPRPPPWDPVLGNEVVCCWWWWSVCGIWHWLECRSACLCTCAPEWCLCTCTHRHSSHQQPAHTLPPISLLVSADHSPGKVVSTNRDCCLPPWESAVIVVAWLRGKDLEQQKSLKSHLRVSSDCLS